MGRDKRMNNHHTKINKTLHIDELIYDKVTYKVGNQVIHQVCEQVRRRMQVRVQVRNQIFEMLKL